MKPAYSDEDFRAILDSFFERLGALLGEGDVIVGIRQGGVELAEALNTALKREGEVGQLDVNFHRDDFGRRQLRKVITASSKLPPLDGARVILIDDVLWTGRTVRAALNELFDFGRPAEVVLAALFDRGGREIPIEATIVGAKLSLGANEYIKVRREDGRLGAYLGQFAVAPEAGARGE